MGSGYDDRLRIAGPEDILPLLIAKLSLGFADLHPHIGLDIIGRDHPIDFAMDAFDVGLRRGYAVQPGIMAVWLTPPERFVVVGTPRIFDEYGRPQHPEDLKEFPCILHSRSGTSDPWQFSIDGKRRTIDVPDSVIVNDIVACLMGALSGGLAYLPLSLIAGYIRSGELEAPLESYAIEEPGVALYFPSERRSLPKLQALIDFVAENFERNSIPRSFVSFRSGDFGL